MVLSDILRFCFTPALQAHIIPGEDHFAIRSALSDFEPYRHCEWQGRSIITPGVCLEKVCEMIFKINGDMAVPVVFEKLHFCHVVDMPVYGE